MWNSHLLLLALDLKLSGGQIKHPGAGHPNSSQHPNLLIPHPPMEHMQCIPHILIMANIRMHCKYATELALHSRFLMYIWENCQNRCNKNKDIFFFYSMDFPNFPSQNLVPIFPTMQLDQQSKQFAPSGATEGFIQLASHTVCSNASLDLWTTFNLSCFTSCLKIQHSGITSQLE